MEMRNRSFRFRPARTWTCTRRHGPAKTEAGAADVGRLVVGSFILEFDDIARALAPACG